MLEIHQHVLGENSASLDQSKLMAKRFEDEIPSHFARLVGKRMCTAVEVRKEDRFDEGLIKRLTGGDTIQTRFMRKDAFDFTPRFKLYLTGNHKPSIYGQDQGIWRRFRLVPFDKEIADHEVDKSLREDLLRQAPGILNWMANGARLWYEEGLGACPVIDEATREYREEQDIFGQLIEEKCEIEDGLEAKASAIYSACKEWAMDEGHMVWNATRFGNALRERSRKLGIERVRRIWELLCSLGPPGRGRVRPSPVPPTRPCTAGGSWRVAGGWEMALAGSNWRVWRVWRVDERKASAPKNLGGAISSRKGTREKPSSLSMASSPSRRTG